MNTSIKSTLVKYLVDQTAEENSERQLAEDYAKESPYRQGRIAKTLAKILEGMKSEGRSEIIFTVRKTVWRITESGASKVDHMDADDDCPF